MMRTLFVLAIFGAVGCLAETGGTLQILNVIPPEDDCGYDGNTSIKVSSGWYDPRGGPGFDPQVYMLVFVVRNNSASSTADSARDVGGEVRVNMGDVGMLGFDACWQSASDGADLSTLADDCSSVPRSQQQFLPSAGLIDSGGGQTPFSIDILSLDHLQSMYGPKFDPSAIPDIGIKDETQLGVDYNGNGISGEILHYSGPELATASAPNEAWGDFPQSESDLVILKMRAVGKDQGGDTVKSNWFTFTVEVCVGCSESACDPLTEIDCGTTPATTGLFGLMSSPAGCVPFQSPGGGSTCTVVNTCQ